MGEDCCKALSVLCVLLMLVSVLVTQFAFDDLYVMTCHPDGTEQLAVTVFWQSASISNSTSTKIVLLGALDGANCPKTMAPAAVLMICRVCTVFAFGGVLFFALGAALMHTDERMGKILLIVSCALVLIFFILAWLSAFVFSFVNASEVAFGGAGNWFCFGCQAPPWASLGIQCLFWAAQICVQKCRCSDGDDDSNNERRARRPAPTPLTAPPAADTPAAALILLDEEDVFI